MDVFVVGTKFNPLAITSVSGFDNVLEDMLSTNCYAILSLISFLCSFILFLTALNFSMFLYFSCFY